MIKLSKYEKETIILTNLADSFYSVYTFDPALKRRLAKFAKEYPECCKLERSTPEGSETYLIEKGRLSLRLTAPYSDKRKKLAGKSIHSNRINNHYHVMPSLEEE